jgi:hypothetical protein
MIRPFPFAGVGKDGARPNRLPIFARLPLGCRFCLIEEMTYELMMKILRRLDVSMGPGALQY